MNLAPVFDAIRKEIGKPGTELRIFDYSPSVGLVEVGEIGEGWTAYRKEGFEGRFLEIVIADGPAASPLSEKFSHVKVGSLYYKVNGVPEAPLDVVDKFRYWLVRCDPTGKADA